MSKRARLIFAALAACVPAMVIACVEDSSLPVDGGSDATANDATQDVTAKDVANDVAVDAAADAAEEEAAPPPPPPCMATDDAGALDATADAYQTFGGKMYGCRGRVGWPARATLCANGCVPCSANDWLAKSQGKAPSHQYWVDDALLYAGGGPPNDCFAVGETDASFAFSCTPQSPMRVCLDGPLDAGGSDAAPSYPYSSVDVDQNICNWTGCSYLPGDAGSEPDASQNLHFGGCDDDLTAGTLCCCP